MIKKNLGEQRTNLACSYSLSSKETMTETQYRNIKAGIEGEIVEECYFLTCFSWLVSLFSCTTQDKLSKDCTVYNEFGTPTLI